MNMLRSLLNKSIPASGLAILVTLGMATAQRQTPTIVEAKNVRHAPAAITSHFSLSKATLQDFALPSGQWKPFSVAVYLGGARKVLRLSPHSVLAANFKLLVVDAKGVREVKPAAETTYQGDLQNTPGAVVAASLIDGKLSALIRIGDELWGIESASKAKPGLVPTAHVVFQAKNSTLAGLRCGNVNPPAIAGKIPAAGGNHAPAVRKVAELAIDADFEYYGRNGSSTTATQNKVTSIMNGVDAIYKRDVDIEHKLTTIIVRTSRVYSWNGNLGSLLSQFRSRWRSTHASIRRDIAHCFTGKGSFSGNIGVAYLRGVCSFSLGYAVSKAYSRSMTTNVGLVAHELGHNWGSGHCSGGGCYIMCPSIGGCGRNLTRFGSSAISAITSFRNSRTCLDTKTATPTLTFVIPSTVQAFSTGKVKLYGTNLDSVTQVDVGSVRLTNNSFAYVPLTGTIDFTPPSPAALGTVQVSVTNPSAKSNSQSMRYVETSPPKLFTEPVWVTKVVPWEFTFGGTPKGLWLLLIAPTSRTFKLFGSTFLLNHVILSSGVLNAAGTGSYKVTVPGVLKGHALWSEVGIINTTLLTVGATNIVKTDFVF